MTTVNQIIISLQLYIILNIYAYIYLIYIKKIFESMKRCALNDLRINVTHCYSDEN